MLFRNRDLSNKYGPWISSIFAISLLPMIFFPNSVLILGYCWRVSIWSWLRVMGKFILGKYIGRREMGWGLLLVGMGRCLRVSFVRMRKMGGESRYTIMAIFTWESLWMVRSMVRENSTGLALVLKIQKMINMSSTMKDSGGEVCRMERDCTRSSMEICM